MNLDPHLGCSHQFGCGSTVENYLFREVLVLLSVSGECFEAGLRPAPLQLRPAICSRLAASAFRRASSFGSVSILIRGKSIVRAKGPPRHRGRRHGLFKIISPSHRRKFPGQCSLRIAAIPSCIEDRLATKKRAEYGSRSADQKLTYTLNNFHLTLNRQQNIRILIV